jgi:pyruvate carboxylase
VYSHEDRLSMHRQKADEAYVIGKRGEYTPVAAYLAADEIVKIAKAHDVNLIHPGYGFLSENAEFARKVEAAGMIVSTIAASKSAETVTTDTKQFVGPTPDTIDALGDKVSARELAIKCKVPVVPGTDGPVEKFEEVKGFTDKHGFPIIIKAAFGGGGRGMRVVWKQEELKEAFERATSEAKSAFGNGTVFVERFLYRPKHIEVQLLGDSHGNVVHLFERDCSVQRRHQKVVELAPAKDLPEETRQAILKDAVALAQSVNYRNAGTAEFLVDQENRHYFIEINPRIQVEHTITEEITGIDIVAAQIQIAAGASLEQLGLTQDRISVRGFAIQCRITTEDPTKGFQPDTGRIEVYRSAGGNGVRLDGESTRSQTMYYKDCANFVLAQVETVSLVQSLLLTTTACSSSARAMVLPTRLSAEKCSVPWSSLESVESRPTFPSWLLSSPTPPLSLESAGQLSSMILPSCLRWSTVRTVLKSCLDTLVILP